MPFSTLSSAGSRFKEGKLVWRRYTVAKAMPRTRRVKLTNEKQPAFFVGSYCRINTRTQHSSHLKLATTRSTRTQRGWQRGCQRGCGKNLRECGLYQYLPQASHQAGSDLSFPSTDTAPTMARSIVKSTTKQNRGRLACAYGASKKAKKS